MSGRSIATVAALGLSLTLLGCSAGATPEASPVPASDRMPLVLARPLFLAGYELAGYYELDADGDGVVEALAVLTLRPSVEQSFTGDSHAILFGRRGGAWSLSDDQRLRGVNASAELRDLTGDGLPELLVFTEETDARMGDFVTPLRYTDHLIVFTYTPDLKLMRLGTFSSSLSGVMRPHSTVGEWGGQPAIQTVQDIQPTGSPLWQPFRVETFAWDGRGFASVQVREQRRLSPVISWLARRNGPWAAASLVLGGVLGFALTGVALRSHLRERWAILGTALLLLAGGVGLWLAEEWLCVPALILIGLAGLGGGRRLAMRLVAGSGQDTEVESGG